MLTAKMIFIMKETPISYQSCIHPQSEVMYPGLCDLRFKLLTLSFTRYPLTHFFQMLPLNTPNSLAESLSGSKGLLQGVKNLYFKLELVYFKVYKNYLVKNDTKFSFKVQQL